MDIFVSQPFSEDFNSVFQVIDDVARSRGLQAYRVDQERVVVDPVSEVITRKLRESRLVIADLTGNNPNVLNEIGQAQILGKPLVLISQDSPTTASFNVRGLTILHYAKENLTSFKQVLKEALAATTSDNENLRSMLVPSSLGRPTKESWYVIVASPLSFRRAIGRHGGYSELRRTSSDHVGVRGILQSFGLLYGFDALPDILDPEDFDDDVITKRMNMYCISSPKANLWTGRLMKKLHEYWVPRLEFRADSSSKDLRNIKVSLYSDDRLLHPPGYEVNKEGDRYLTDFGLIIRAPNPYHDDNMVTVIAGRSSLGTEAACRAFIDPKKIAEIRRRLNAFEIDLENHKRPFWVLVSMQRARGDKKEEAIPESLRLHQVDTFNSP